VGTALPHADPPRARVMLPNAPAYAPRVLPQVMRRMRGEMIPQVMRLAREWLAGRLWDGESEPPRASGAPRERSSLGVTSESGTPQ
jgi:hypothetical protein